MQSLVYLTLSNSSFNKGQDHYFSVGPTLISENCLYRGKIILDLFSSASRDIGLLLGLFKLGRIFLKLLEVIHRSLEDLRTQEQKILSVKRHKK